MVPALEMPIANGEVNFRTINLSEKENRNKKKHATLRGYQQRMGKKGEKPIWKTDFPTSFYDQQDTDMFVTFMTILLQFRHAQKSLSSHSHTPHFYPRVT